MKRKVKGLYPIKIDKKFIFKKFPLNIPSKVYSDEPKAKLQLQFKQILRENINSDNQRSANGKVSK